MTDHIPTPEQIEKSLKELFAWMEQGKAGMANNMLQSRFESYSAADNSYISSYMSGDWATNPMGVIHGGIVSTYLDTAMGCLTYCMAGNRMTPTISMQINYLRPVIPGKRLFIEAQIKKMGRFIIHAAAEAWAGEDRTILAATASGSYFCGSPGTEFEPAEPLVT